MGIYLKFLLSEVSSYALGNTFKLVAKVKKRSEFALRTT